MTSRGNLGSRLLISYLPAATKSRSMSPRSDLRRFNLSFDDVVAAIQSASLNLPAGAIKGQDGDIRVQTRGQAYDREDFERIVVVTARDGTQIYLGEIASIQDAFEDIDTLSRFNGMPGHALFAYVTTIRMWCSRPA